MGALRDPANRVSPKAIRMWLLESLVAFVFFLGGSLLVSRWVDGSDWSWVPRWLAADAWLLPVAVMAVTVPFLWPSRSYGTSCIAGSFLGTSSTPGRGS